MGKYQATGAHKIHSYFSASGGVLSFYRDNASTQLAFGESGTGLDVKFMGDTASAYVLWDESADTLEGASSAVLAWAGSASFAGAVGMSGSVGIAGAASFSDVAAFSGSVEIAGALGVTGAASFSDTIGMSGSVEVSGAASFAGAVGITGADTNITSASTHIGNASTDRVGFFGATATIQPAFSSTGGGLADVLVSLGLMRPS